MLVFENKFSANISQTQQSSIEHPTLGRLSTAATVRVKRFFNGGKLVFENKFSANISQTQQSLIEHSPLGHLSTAATVRVKRFFMVRK